MLLLACDQYYVADRWHETSKGTSGITFYISHGKPCEDFPIADTVDESDTQAPQAQEPHKSEDRIASSTVDAMANAHQGRSQSILDLIAKVEHLSAEVGALLHAVQVEGMSTALSPELRAPLLERGDALRQTNPEARSRLY